MFFGHNPDAALRTNAATVQVGGFESRRRIDQGQVLCLFAGQVGAFGRAAASRLRVPFMGFVLIWRSGCWILQDQL